MPVIDYDLALLFQPMLVLGISIGVAFNVIFADWMITVLLIILFIFTSTKAFLKGVDTWKKETIMKKEAAQRITNGDGNGGDYKALPAVPDKKRSGTYYGKCTLATSARSLFHLACNSWDDQPITDPDSSRSIRIRGVHAVHRKEKVDFPRGRRK